MNVPQNPPRKFTASKRCLSFALLAHVLTQFICSGCGSTAATKTLGWLRGATDADGGENHWNDPISSDPQPNESREVGRSAAVSSEQGTGKNWLLFDGEQQQGVALSEISEHAQSWIAMYGSDMGIAPSEFYPIQRQAKELTPSLRVFSFNRFWRGIPVRDGTLSISYSLDADGMWRMREVYDRSMSGLLVSNEASSSISEGRARELLGQQDSRAALDKVSVREVLIVHSSGAAGEVGMLKRSTEIVYRPESSPGSRAIFLENGSEILLESEDRVYAAAALTSKVYDRSYFDKATVEAPMAHAAYTSGGSTKKLDGDGGYGTERATTATLSLDSPMAKVVNFTDNQGYSFAVDLSDGGKSVTGDTPERARALNVYSAIQRIRRFALQFTKTTDAGVYTTGPLVRINANNGVCNAYFSPTDLQLVFYAQGTDGANTCANTAEINDVTQHEWGHSLDNAVGTNPGITDGAFSEGIGDITSVMYSGVSAMGQGFFLNTATPVRELQNVARFPPANNAQREVHTQGLIIGGSFWDMRKALITRHGATKGAYHAAWLFFRHLLTTDRYTDSYQAILAIDDDDGNAATPSPNRCLINKAFSDHGLATLIANCTDVFAPKIAVGSDLQVDIKSETNDNATLLASTPDKSVLKLCMDEHKNCDTAAKFTVEMAVDEVRGTKTVFSSKTTVKIGELLPVTVGKFDTTGALTASRTFRVSAK